jgi:streptogramin lyase
MRATLSILSICSLTLCLSLAGCTITSTGTVEPTAQKVILSGSVYGGSQPVVGAHVYLYAANTQSTAGPGIPAGPGVLSAPSNASVSLLQAAANTAADTNGNYYVTTGASGTFSLTGDYAACTPGEQLYLYASGGNAGAGDNTAIGMMAIIGGCTATYPNSTTRVTINEMSTVAAAYAIAGFASDATHIADDEAVGTNASAAIAKTGMANAFANSANLVTLATANALSTTPSNNGTIPTTLLNTIASILANCVQTSGPTSPSCVELFNFTGTPTTGDTATAAIRLAQNPVGVPGGGVSITALINSLPQNVAFTPILLTPPNDFTIPIVYAGTGINAPNEITVDSTGNIWVANEGGNSVSELASTGAAYTETDYTDPSLNPPNAVAIDLNGSVWLTNYGGGSLTEFTGSGTNYTANSYSGGGLNLPENIAIDGNNNVWATNLVPGSISEFVGSGTSYTGTNYTGVSFPAAIAVDASENIWTGDNFDGIATEFTPGSGTYNPTQYTNANLASGNALGIDANGSIWVVSGSSNNLGKFSGPSNSYTTQNTYSGGGLNAPAALAVDGSGNIWIANGSGDSISEFSNLGAALSPTKGFTGTDSLAGSTGGPLTGPTGIAVDGSGNVWVSDSSNTAVEFIGAATPATVPLATAVHFQKLGARP